MYNSDSSAASSDVSNSMCVTKELIEKMLGKEATALETLLSKVRLFLMITDHNTAHETMLTILKLLMFIDIDFVPLE